MRSLVIGMGEVGTGLAEVLQTSYSVVTKDKNEAIGTILKRFLPAEIMHICFPYSEDFESIVVGYIKEFSPRYTVIHSTVPVGTTNKIRGIAGEYKVFHSPIRGRHPDIGKELKKFVKYVSFDSTDIYEAQEIARYFEKVGIKTRTMPDTRSTELMKLLALSRKGVYLAFAKEQDKICSHFGFDYCRIVADFEKTRSEGVEEARKQPIYYPFQDFVGGHCITENMELLMNQIFAEDPQLEIQLLCNAHHIDKGTTVWDNCNIYPDAKIGKGCSIGFNCEIDNGVVIGNNVRVGAFCFMPSGVMIEDNCFIGPRVTFSNDKHPPSDKKQWAETLVKKGAMVGVGSVILPGITIGENAVVGAGSVVTKDVPDNEVWYGQAAYHHGKKEDVYANSHTPA